MRPERRTEVCLLVSADRQLRERGVGAGGGEDAGDGSGSAGRPGGSLCQAETGPRAGLRW